MCLDGRSADPELDRDPDIVTPWARAARTSRSLPVSVARRAICTILVRPFRTRSINTGTPSGGSTSSPAIARRNASRRLDAPSSEGSTPHAPAARASSTSGAAGCFVAVNTRIDDPLLIADTIETPRSSPRSSCTTTRSGRTSRHASSAVVSSGTGPRTWTPARRRSASNMSCASPGLSSTTRTSDHLHHCKEHRQGGPGR